MLAPTLLDRVFPYAPPRHAKAETGIGATWMTVDTPLSSILDTPQKLMATAQRLYHTDLWVRKAENVVSTKFATVGWHLEDKDENEIDDESPGPYQSVVDLIEHPYSPKPEDPATATPKTRSALWSLTSRHMGLCGNAFWYLDQADALGGVPLQILYINPARMTDATDRNGNLIGWVLDADARGNGTPLEKKNVLHFTLEPPDNGHWGVGLVESVITRTDLSRFALRHATTTVASGGRLAGVMSPKTGEIPQDKYDQLVRDMRNTVERPESAKRVLVLQGPVDFQAWAGTPAEIDLLSLLALSRDDVLALWGVPGSQIGLPGAAGLNSGGTKDTDIEILWQNAISPRLDSFGETLQFELIDRYKAHGIELELEIEKPTFDDESPLFTIANLAKDQPLRNSERRTLMGLDPFGDPALDNAVWMPVSVVSLAQAPDALTGQVTPDATLDVIKRQVPVPEAAGGAPPAEVKAKQLPSIGPLRDKLAASMQRDVAKLLSAMGKDVARRIRGAGSHLISHPKDIESLMPTDWELELARVLRPHIAQIAETTDQRVASYLGKAGLETTLKQLLHLAGLRIKGINEYTRLRVAELIADGIAKGLSPAQLADTIEQAPIFDELRAETIARTETGTLLNLAATTSYRTYGVDKVQVYDGEQDDICAPVDGAVWSLDEAEADPLGHPNCTRTFAPIIEGAVL